MRLSKKCGRLGKPTSHSAVTTWARMFADLKEKEKLHPERVVSPPARESAPDDSAPDSANRPNERHPPVGFGLLGSGVETAGRGYKTNPPACGHRETGLTKRTRRAMSGDKPVRVRPASPRYGFFAQRMSANARYWSQSNSVTSCLPVLTWYATSCMIG